MDISRSALVTLTILAINCSAPTRYPITPNAAAAATFKIEVSTQGEVLGTATAWIVGVHNGITDLMTAGHVCPIDSLTFTYNLVDQDGKVHATMGPQMRSDEPDLCLIAARGVLGAPMAIADKDPEYGEPVAYVGAPVGYYGNGIAPMYMGHYVGGDTITAPTAPGASGSAIYTKDGVIGVLVSLSVRYHHIVHFVPRKDLIQFLSLTGNAPSKCKPGECASQVTKCQLTCSIQRTECCE